MKIEISANNREKFEIVCAIFTFIVLVIVFMFLFHCIVEWMVQPYAVEKRTLFEVIGHNLDYVKELRIW